MDDRYPATDQHQSVHLDYPYPDARRDLNRWLPLVKWLLAIPHYIVLFFLDLAALVVVIVAWFAIVFTGRYPRGLFDFVEGVIRWHNRVIAYAWVLVTDRYRRSAWPNRGQGWTANSESVPSRRRLRGTASLFGPSRLAGSWPCCAFPSAAPAPGRSAAHRALPGIDQPASFAAPTRTPPEPTSRHPEQ
jgi:hypothetical protein